MDGPRGKHTGNTRQPEGPQARGQREARRSMRQCRHVRLTCATIRGSASGGHDTCFKVFTRFICVARGSHVELTRRSRQRSAGSRGLYTGIKAYFRRADVSGSRSGHAPRARADVAYVRRGALSLRLLVLFSYLDWTPREPTSRDSRETRRRLSPGHISVCNEQNRQPSLYPALCF